MVNRGESRKNSPPGNNWRWSLWENHVQKSKCSRQGALQEISGIVGLVLRSSILPSLRKTSSQRPLAIGHTNQAFAS
jgi:hypothetical protein